MKKISHRYDLNGFLALFSKIIPPDGSIELYNTNIRQVSVPLIVIKAVTYNKLIEEPEDIIEEHELQGECPHCKDCPLCDRVVDIYGNIDARVKWGKCTRYGMVSVNLNKRVCAAYWESEERR